jgi:hypothetical protein
MIEAHDNDISAAARATGIERMSRISIDKMTRRLGVKTWRRLEQA